jgi:hypothetical protein
VVKEALNAATEEDDPLHGVKGVSINILLYTLWVILAIAVPYVISCFIVDLSLGR